MTAYARAYRAVRRAGGTVGAAEKSGDRARKRTSKYLASRRAHDRTYRATHAEELQTRSRAYRVNHREKIAAYRATHRSRRLRQRRAWGQAHKGQLRAYNRAWGQAHKDEKLAYNRTWRAAHRTELAIYHGHVSRLDEAQATFRLALFPLLPRDARHQFALDTIKDMDTTGLDAASIELDSLLADTLGI